MPKLRRNGFRFQVLRTISETGPIDEFALAEEMCLRSQKQLPIRVRLMLRVLFELEAKGLDSAHDFYDSGDLDVGFDVLHHQSR